MPVTIGFCAVPRCVLLMAVYLALGAAFQPALAQDVDTQATAPTPVEITARLRVIADSAAVAEQEIARLADAEPLLETYRINEVRQGEIAGLLRTMGALEYSRPERLFRLRDQALAHEQRLEQLSARIAERVDALALLRAQWLAYLGTLAAWREAVPLRPEVAAQVPEIEEAIARVEEVLERIGSASAELGTIRSSTDRLSAGNRALLAELAALRAGRREALLRADQPSLYSPAYLVSLRSPAAWRPAEALTPESLGVFLREHAGLLLLHLVLVLAVWGAARRLRMHAVPEGGWSGILDRPAALAVFATTAVLARRYIVAPPLWDVLTWALLTGTGAVLAWALVRGWALRVLIAAVASLYPLMLLAEALRVPTPVFRLGLTAVAGLALLGLPLLGARADAGTPGGRRARRAVAVATVLSAAVLIAQLFGFDQLSRWLVHAALVSAYVIFAAVLVVVLARGALRTLLRKEFVGRTRLVGTLAVPLAERLVAFVQVVLVVVVALILLDIWELAPAPIETWRALVAWGVDVLGLRITLGRLLSAALVVYLALLASWLARSVITSEAKRGWSFERGVAESINSLVHYLLITLGVLFALGALGVELQNFAIVAGALGVGIGFGLQNVVNNFASGLILLFERPVRVGDTVEMDGEWGTIKKIGLRSTVVVTFAQAELIVPNGDLVSQKVTNWTLTNPTTRLALQVGVAYGSNVGRVLEILAEAERAHPSVVDEPAPVALFIGFGDSSLDFELRVWVREVAARMPVRSAVLAEIDRRFREAGVEIPFPQRDLHIRSVGDGVAQALRGAEPVRSDGASG
jgi:potassium-dependent mechanosensitive channel